MACACGLAFCNVSYRRLYFKEEFGHWVQTGLAVYRVIEASVELGFVFTSSRASRGNPVPFWFIKLFIEVFVLSFALPKSLLQSIKSLSTTKPPLWECGTVVLMYLCFQTFCASACPDSWGWEKISVNIYAKLPLILLPLGCSWFGIVLPVTLTAMFSFICLPDCLHMSLSWGEEGCPCTGCLHPGQSTAEQSGHARHGSLRRMSGYWTLKTNKQNL